MVFVLGFASTPIPAALPLTSSVLAPAANAAFPGCSCGSIEVIFVEKTATTKKSCVVLAKPVYTRACGEVNLNIPISSPVLNPVKNAS